jgi:predicted DNA-binding transcriptional regulator AlpA
MKKHPPRPELSGVTPAMGQAKLIPASPNTQLASQYAAKPANDRSKASLSNKLPNFDTLPDSGFVRLPCLRLLFACSNATIWRWVQDAKIPAPKKLGPRVTAWNVGELRQVISAHMKGEAA